MNNSYECLDGNVILKDRNGTKYVTPNTDNMQEVVQQENQVEIIDHKIEEYQRAIKQNLEDSKINKKAAKWFVVGSFLIPVLAGLMGLANNIIFASPYYELFDMPNQSIVNIMHFFHTESYAMYDAIAMGSSFGILCIPMGLAIALTKSFKARSLLRSSGGYLKVVELLQKKKTEAVKKLEQLKKEAKTLDAISQEMGFKVVEVDNSRTYEELETAIDKAYNTGLKEIKTLSKKIQ